MGGLKNKDNVCPMCNGYSYTPGTDPSTGEIYCEDVDCVCEDGTLVGYLENWELWNKDQMIDRVSKENAVLVDWIKVNTKCKTCKGDQYKTWSGIICPECKLEGLGMWPG